MNNTTKNFQDYMEKVRKEVEEYEKRKMEEELRYDAYRNIQEDL